MPLVQHIRLRCKDGGVIAPTVREQRIVALAVLTRGEPFGLLTFSAADTHLHLAAACTPVQAGELARRVEIALTRHLGLVGFVPALIDQVRDQRHLYNLCDYILRQDKRHGVEHLDPTRECSNLPDLLGARLLGAYTWALLRRWLPRFCRRDVLRLFGLTSFAPTDGPLELLPSAAAAVICRLDLRGHSLEVTAALAAAVRVAAGRLAVPELASLLGVSRRRVYRLQLRQPEAGLIQAIRCQLRLRWEKQSPSARASQRL